MTLEVAETEVSNRIYEAALIFERMEGMGLIHGNGHHIAQNIARHAIEVLRERWQSERVKA